MNESMVRFLALPASVQTGTLLGKVTWAKAVEAECICLESGDHLVSRERLETSAGIEGVLLLLA